MMSSPTWCLADLLPN